jgi:hypothetical protein
MFGLGHLALRESFNKTLTLTILLIAFSQFNFGFDQQGFASTQAMDAFDRQFGEFDPEKKKWYLPTVWLSFFNGFNYLGQAFGMYSGCYRTGHGADHVFCRCCAGQLCQQEIRQADVYVHDELLGSCCRYDRGHFEEPYPDLDCSGIQL